jgi:site-specific DNA recombinase
MHVIGYVRVSSEEQAAEGVSLEAQESRIRAWGELNGAVSVRIFTDAGISGKRSDNRPALVNALSAVGRGGVLVVYSLSRLARSTRDTLDIAEHLERRGADLVSLSEKIDTTSASGKMVFRLLAVLAEFERDLISERTKSSLAHKRKRSERCGQIPYGYDLVEGTDGATTRSGRASRLVRNETEQSVILKMLKWRARGWSARRIAEELTRRGVPSKRGGDWFHTAVGKVLRRVDRDGQAEVSSGKGGKGGKGGRVRGGERSASGPGATQGETEGSPEGGRGASSQGAAQGAGEGRGPEAA